MIRDRSLSRTADLPLTSWLNERHSASGRWLGKPCILAAWAGLLLAFVTPPHGTGFTVCWLKSATGLPCPGCGLTRSLSCALRGMFTESWHYHPMGFLVLVLFITIAAASVLPSFRNCLTKLIESNSRMSNTLYLGFVISFVAFGLVRSLLTFVHLLP